MKLLGFIPLAREGLIFILISLFFTIIQTLFFSFNGFTVLLSLITLFIICFFRNPDRTTPKDNDSIISPADGTVIFIGEVIENQLLKRKMKKISIFMSVFNVHVNRMPLSGTIKHILYNPGKFFNAATPKSSLENEQNAILVERSDKAEIIFIQIAGFIARRIVSYLTIGNSYQVGERMGMIRFGSRLDVYFPLDSEVKVKLKDKTRSGETILAKLPLKGTL